MARQNGRTLPISILDWLPPCLYSKSKPSLGFTLKNPRTAYRLRTSLSHKRTTIRTAVAVNDTETPKIFKLKIH